MIRVDVKAAYDDEGGVAYGFDRVAVTWTGRRAEHGSRAKATTSWEFDDPAAARAFAALMMRNPLVSQTTIHEVDG